MRAPRLRLPVPPDGGTRWKVLGGVDVGDGGFYGDLLGAFLPLLAFARALLGRRRMLGLDFLDRRLVVLGKLLQPLELASESLLVVMDHLRIWRLQHL